MASLDAIEQPEDGPGLVDYGWSWVDSEMVAELGVWRWDLSSGRLEISERLRTIFGLAHNHQVETVEQFMELVHGKDRLRVQKELELAVEGTRSFSFQARVVRPDGGIRTVQSTGSPTDITRGRVTEMVGVTRNISAPVSAESRVGQLERRLADIVANSPALIVIKDLDLRYRMCSQEICELTGRPMEEIIGRTASEILPVGPATRIDAQAVEALATRETVHCDIELEIDQQRRVYHLVSFALTDPSGNPVELCCIATDVTDSRLRDQQTRLRRETAQLVSSALRENRMVAVSQPIVDINGAQRVSEELLVRLTLPHHAGQLQPGAFLPLAERFNLVQDIDVWMVGRACQVAEHRPVQVNLSAVTFDDARALDQILQTLHGAPEVARRIVFEITETAAAHHFDAAHRFALAVCELGCGLALDDFGTGFGSFTYLRRLPLRYLKIDRSFVTGLTHSHDDRRIVGSMIGIARQFDLWTIAEGVEDAATLSVLRDLGADFAQGFHLGRPAPLT